MAAVVFGAEEGPTVSEPVARHCSGRGSEGRAAPFGSTSRGS